MLFGSAPPPFGAVRYGRCCPCIRPGARVGGGAAEPSGFGPWSPGVRMTVYVSCHGGLFDTRPETFVPYYMPTVKFYAKADENLYQSNELGALARADLGIGDANDTYAAKGTIPNYVLTPDSSKEAAMATFFEPSAGSLYLIPKVTALCTWDGKQDDG